MGKPFLGDFGVAFRNIRSGPTHQASTEAITVMLASC